MFEKRSSCSLDGPIPPLGLLDYPSTMKFRELAFQQFHACHWDTTVVMDWMLRTLLNSLMADSASRIFLPKTQTRPFLLDDLLPFSAVEPSGRTRVPLAKTYLLSPAWSNKDTAAALHQAATLPVEEVAGGETIGVYLKELNLAIVDTAVHESLCIRFLGRGETLMDAYSLRDLARVIRTDGENWYVTEEDGSVTYCPVLEPRMAALYRLGVERYCPELLPPDQEEV